MQSWKCGGRAAQSDCYAIAMRLLCDCYAIAMRLLCGCYPCNCHAIACNSYAIAMRLLCDCYAIAMRLLRDCYAIAMRLLCGCHHATAMRLPCDCYAIAMRLLWGCYAVAMRLPAHGFRPGCPWRPSTYVHGMPTKHEDRRSSVSTAVTAMLRVFRRSSCQCTFQGGSQQEQRYEQGWSEQRALMATRAETTRRRKRGFTSQPSELTDATVTVHQRRNAQPLQAGRRSDAVPARGGGV